MTSPVPRAKPRETDGRRPPPAVITRTIQRLLRVRGAGKTICPSEVARALSPEAWRPLMPAVRAQVERMVDAREVVVLQRGEPVDAKTARGAIRIARADVAKTTYASAYRGIDFRAHPELYRVGRGEEGVLIAEPYKTELLPLWRFRTPGVARASADALWAAFVAYREARDFVGMDMARKYLQMGFTRARRYANHPTGRKYAEPDVGRARASRVQLARAEDPEKSEAASIFYDVWQKAERDRAYKAWRAQMRAAAAEARKASARTPARSGG